uniref:PCI domain-containing protein n=1 Tax=Dunaliella tertiolecta TaxID=3047 RepID=A0A7S3RAI0_DUNTE|mmetsp:Transcript_13168/g.35855  ORF Transcript_13168/g.35855 Transcript_13168/m.35855 type:complete len:486 (+) Transcript_13168:105-1562(+)
MDEFTAANIGMEEDKRAAEKSTVDMEKMRKDIGEQIALANQGKLHEALQGLLNLEKVGRLAEDVTATKAACAAILDACHQAKEWKLMEEQIMVLAKRRSQLKQAVQAVVRQAMSYLDQIEDKDTMVSLAKTLQAVTEGKIFVEIERARLTQRLANIKEAEGNVSEAAEILQEVAVETFGAMSKQEKIAFILEQVRLCLDKQDYVRAHILSKKIAPKAFVERKGEVKGEIGIEGTAIEAPPEGLPPLSELKLKYYHLMIRYYSYYNNYLEMTRCYKAVYEVPEVQADPSRWTPVLKKICWFIVLSPPYSTEQGSSSDRLTLLLGTLQDKKLGELPAYKALLSTFNSSEIIRWLVFQSQYKDEFAAETEVFSDSRRSEALKLRVIEHNVMVAARYYSEITTQRLSQLLDLSLDDTEKHLSDLVVCKAVAAKVDRPSGLVRFGKRQEPEDLLNNWSGNISRLLDLVEKSCQQISKECMIHKVQLKTVQ